MKKKLEDKIMAQVYSVEASRTGLSIGTKIVGFVVIGGMVGLFIQVVSEYLTDGGIINLFAAILEDKEVFTSQIGSVLQIVYDEIPLPLVIAVAIGSMICIGIVLTIIFNFEKIRNRIRALILHWTQK